MIQERNFFRQEGRGASSPPSPEGRWPPGGETCYRLPLLPLQAGHLADSGVVGGKGVGRSGLCCGGVKTLL